MGSNTHMTQYSLFSFLRFLPIPELLKKPIPGLAILDKKLDVPGLRDGVQENKARRPQHSKHSAQKKKGKTAAAIKRTAAGSVVCAGKVTVGDGAPYAIGEENFTITESTWIFGEVKLGSTVQLTGLRRRDGILEATKIIVS